MGFAGDGAGVAGFEGGAAGFDGGGEGAGHADRVGCDRDGGVYENGVGSHFHGGGGVGGLSDAGVDDHGNTRLLDDDFELGTGVEAAVAADGRAEWHDGGDADILEALSENGVGVDVGEDDEIFFDEDFGGFEGFNRVGEEVIRVGVDFEFYPIGEAGGPGEAGEADGFFGVHGAGGVGEDEVAFGFEKFEDVGERVFLAGEVGAFEGDGDEAGLGGGEGVAHGFVAGEFSGADEEAGVEGAAGDDQWFCGELMRHFDWAM